MKILIIAILAIVALSKPTPYECLLENVEFFVHEPVKIPVQLFASYNATTGLHDIQVAILRKHLDYHDCTQNWWIPALNPVKFNSTYIDDTGSIGTYLHQIFTTDDMNTKFKCAVKREWGFDKYSCSFNLAIAQIPENGGHGIVNLYLTYQAWVVIGTQKTIPLDVKEYNQSAGNETQLIEPITELWFCSDENCVAKRDPSIPIVYTDLVYLKFEVKNPDLQFYTMVLDAVNFICQDSTYDPLMKFTKNDPHKGYVVFGGRALNTGQCYIRAQATLKNIQYNIHFRVHGQLDNLNAYGESGLFYIYPPK